LRKCGARAVPARSGRNAACSVVAAVDCSRSAPISSIFRILCAANRARQNFLPCAAGRIVEI
jgi:hypothetical protein